jgi:hypothetical protein
MKIDMRGLSAKDQKYLEFVQNHIAQRVPMAQGLCVKVKSFRSSGDYGLGANVAYEVWLDFVEQDNQAALTYHEVYDPHDSQDPNGYIYAIHITVNGETVT